MAIIYTYPSGAVKADDLIIVSEQDTAGNPTKNITVSALANFIATTGTGTGTTDYIVKWNDGPNGLIGDSIIIERPPAGIFLSTYIETTDISIQKMEINSWLADSTLSTGNAGDVLTSTGGGAAATVTWSPVTSIIPWPYQYSLANTLMIQGENPATAGNSTTTLGVGAGASLTSASTSVIIGSDAGKNMTSTESNVYIGANSGNQNQSGTKNVGIGRTSLYAETLANESVAIGWFALSNQNQAASINVNNVAVGSFAGNNITTGTQDTLLGSQSSTAAAGDTNSTVIGANAVGHGSNTVVIGDANVIAWEPGADNTVRLGDKGSYGFTELILVSPDTTRWQITVDNAGNLVVA